MQEKNFQLIFFLSSISCTSLQKKEGNTNKRDEKGMNDRKIRNKELRESELCRVSKEICILCGSCLPKEKDLEAEATMILREELEPQDTYFQDRREYNGHS